jgi:uncharacterized protein DUF222
MSSPTFPDPDPDAPGPDSSRPVPAGGNDGDPEPPEASGFPPPGDEEEDSAVYLGELMAAAAAGEELTAADISGAGFGEDGTAQQLIPGPVLATLVHAATTDEKILATLSDDDLVGVIAAVRRIGSFAAWAELTAIREYATRPGPRRPAPAPGATPGATPGAAPGAPAGPASGAGGNGARPRSRGVDSRDPNAAVAGLPGNPKIREFAAEALAPDLMGMTWQTAEGQIIYACTVAGRLPVTFAALRAGKIHPVHLRIAEDETAYLAVKYLAEADEKLAAAAQSKTFGQFRSYAHRVVLKLDPESALRRKNEARKDAHVRPFREASGNAGMSARELPPDQVLASWQHVDQRARDLRAAGIPGTLKQLRVMAYLDLLQERDSRTVPPAPACDPRPGDLDHLDDTGDLDDCGDPGDTNGPDESDASEETGRPDAGGQDDTGQGPDRSAGPSETDDGPGGPGGTDGPGGNGGSGRGPRNRPGGTGPAGTGRPAGGTGPSLAAQVTLTIPWETWQGTSDTPGEAAGFGLLDPETARDLVDAAARHPDTRWCYTVLHPDGTAAAHACAPGRHPGGPPDPRTLKFNSVIRGPCNHAHAQAGYRPGRKLRHLIAARNATCTAPGCGQAAANCDLDHTTPWHLGGVTCECNLAPLCRHHHRVKQAYGWWLDQSEPGLLRWRTPAGRTHTTTPTEYPI